MMMIPEPPLPPVFDKDAPPPPPPPVFTVPEKLGDTPVPAAPFAPP